MTSDGPNGAAWAWQAHRLPSDVPADTCAICQLPNALLDTGSIALVPCDEVPDGTEWVSADWQFEEDHFSPEDYRHTKSDQRVVLHRPCGCIRVFLPGECQEWDVEGAVEPFVSLTHHSCPFGTHVGHFKGMHVPFQDAVFHKVFASVRHAELLPSDCALVYRLQRRAPCTPSTQEKVLPIGGIRLSVQHAVPACDYVGIVKIKDGLWGVQPCGPHVKLREVPGTRRVVSKPLFIKSRLPCTNCVALFSTKQNRARVIDDVRKAHPFV